MNSRKELYQRVDLSEIEEFVRKRGLSAQFITLAEAREYRETLALRAPKVATATVEVSQFPANPFEASGTAAV